MDVIRHERLTGVDLATRDDLSSEEAARLFADPGPAIDALTADLLALWDYYRSGDVEARRVGVLELSSGAYLQWIGYSDRLVIEVSSNAYLADSARLSEAHQAALQDAGFRGPDEDEPNFWMTVHHRRDIGRTAFAMVVVLTAVFGVYAG